MTRGRITKQLEPIFADDLTFGRRVDYATWKRRSLFNRLLELLSVPIRPQM